MFKQKSGNRYKVTVIDDEKEIVEIVKYLLESRDFDVSFAYGGYSGLEVIKKEIPDLIILDIMMHDLDGRDVIKELRKDVKTENIPVIFLTGRDEDFEVEYGMELGAADYVVKPYKSRDFLKKVQNVLKQYDK